MDYPEVFKRKYRFDGDLMSLKPLYGTNREILWQRVRGERATIGRTGVQKAFREMAEAESGS